MWIGFGQTVAKNYKAFSIPKLNTSIEGCPANWTKSVEIEISEPEPER